MYINGVLLLPRMFHILKLLQPQLLQPHKENQQESLLFSFTITISTFSFVFFWNM